MWEDPGRGARDGEHSEQKNCGGKSRVEWFPLMLRGISKRTATRGSIVWLATEKEKKGGGTTKLIKEMEKFKNMGKDAEELRNRGGRKGKKCVSIGQGKNGAGGEKLRKAKTGFPAPAMSNLTLKIKVTEQIYSAKSKNLSETFIWRMEGRTSLNRADSTALL